MQPRLRTTALRGYYGAEMDYPVHSTVKGIELDAAFPTEVLVIHSDAAPLP